MPEISITIPGKPIAKKRPKFFRRGGFVGAYNCQETEEGKIMQQIHVAAPGLQPVDGPIRMTLHFGMPIPDSASKKAKLAMVSGETRHTKKPDLDNLVKFVKDCANGILWRDDSQVIQLLATKEYSEFPRTEIEIAW